MSVQLLIIFLYSALLITFSIIGPLIMKKLKELDNDIYYVYFVTGYVISLIMYFIIFYSIINSTFMYLNRFVLGMFFILYIVLILVPALIPMNKKYKKLEETKALIYAYCSVGLLLLLLLLFTFFINKNTTKSYKIEYTDIAPELKLIYEESKIKEDFQPKCIDKLKGKKYGEITLTHDEYKSDNEIIFDIGNMERNHPDYVKDLEISDRHITSLCDVFYDRFKNEGTPP